MEVVVSIFSVMFIVLVMFPSVVLGQPYLVSDPNPGVTDNEVLICVDQVVCDQTSGTVYGPYPAEADGSIMVDLGLLNLPDGDLEFQARAINKWGVSNWSVPLLEKKQVPGVPSGLGVAP